MENFNVDEGKSLGAVEMTVSPICYTESGEKYAYVSFSDEVRTAEGKIPDCKIVKNEGFTEEEVKKLEEYMNENLSFLKQMASSLNIMNAFMK